MIHCLVTAADDAGIKQTPSSLQELPCGRPRITALVGRLEHTESSAQSRELGHCPGPRATSDIWELTRARAQWMP
eukprot:41598-Eustigmatos_ZCMA.PRE.1